MPPLSPRICAFSVPSFLAWRFFFFFGLGKISLIYKPNIDSATCHRHLRLALTFHLFFLEAIIWSISEIDHVDHQRAEKIFQQGFEHAVTNDEVLQLTTKLKQRKPSAETREERLKYAERALKRHFAES